MCAFEIVISGCRKASRSALQRLSLTEQRIVIVKWWIYKRGAYKLFKNIKN